MTTPLFVAQQAAWLAAEMLRSRFANLAEVTVDTKQNRAAYDGIVTSADVESETAIVNSIRATFPDHQFLAEEQHSETIDPDSIEDLWIIDPLDGTNNFAHGIDQYGVSIAHYQFGKASCGVVIRPESGDMTWAEQGRGAYRQRGQAGVARVIHVNQHAQLDQTMIGVGFYYDRGAMMRRTLATIEQLFEHQVHGIRRMGAASLDLVQVATGGFGGFFEFRLSPWDFAAARLIVEEAGGTVTDCDGLGLPLKTSSVLASNGQLHPVLLAVIHSKPRAEDAAE